VADVTSNDAASDVAQADSAAVDSSSSADSSDSSSSSGSLVPCTTAGQTNCVQCPGSTDGVCTTTEAIFVNIDITNHAVTSNTPDDNMNGCYQCMLNGSCIDSPSEHQSDLECEDLGTATFTDGTMPTQTGAAATLCDDAISCVVGTTGNGCALNAEGEAFCYCGSGPGSTIGDCDSTGSAVNGACLSTLTLGYKYTETDTSDVLPHPDGQRRALRQGHGDPLVRGDQRLHAVPAAMIPARYWPLLVAAVLLPRVAFAALPRYPGDAQEVDIMRQASPRAAESLERGEELARGGQLAEALGLFQQAEKEQPSSSLLRRRECEALTSLGRYDEAVKACLDARVNRPNNVNTRALARALIGRARPPVRRKPSSSVAAPDAAAEVRPRRNHRTRGCLHDWHGNRRSRHAAAVHRRIGAPRRCERPRGQARSRPFAVEVPSAAILAGLVRDRGPVLGHSLRSRAACARDEASERGQRQRYRRQRSSRWRCSLPLRLVPTTRVRKAGWLSHWPIDKDNPESSIPTEAQRNAEPLEFGYWLQDLALRAEHESTKTGDHAQAVKYYLAMAIAVPEPAVSYVKVCEEYEALGDIEKAQNACGVALSHDGVKVKDYARFVHLVLRKPGALSTKEVAALGHVIDHMKSEPEGRDAAYELECEVGTRTENVDQLLECTALLGTLAPEAPSTLTYEWELAVLEGRFADARDLIAHAKSIGVHTDNMTKTTDAKEKQSRVRTALLAATIALLLGSAAFGAYAWLGRRRLHVKAA
jgi:tetratricopeptide (TPR) repeat protein